MTEDRRLRDKLSKLAAEDSGAGMRRIGGRAAGDALRAIVEEIDETILARLLTFRAEGGSALRLEAANRRLLGVVELPEEGFEDLDRDSVLSPLVSEDDAALTQIAEALRRFAGGETEITVTAGPLGRSVGHGNRGRSASALAGALGIDLYDRPAPVIAPDPSKGFDAGLARLALAVAVISGEEPSPATGQDAAAVGKLSALGREGIATLIRELGPEATRAGRFLLLTGREETLFLGQKPSGRAIAALLPSDHAGAVVALWRATGGG